jgi:hypothetical protein
MGRGIVALPPEPGNAGTDATDLHPKDGIVGVLVRRVYLPALEIFLPSDYPGRLLIGMLVDTRRISYNRLLRRNNRRFFVAVETQCRPLALRPDFGDRLR